MAISIPPKGDDAKRIGAHFTPLSVVALDIPELKVFIKEGGFWNAEGEYVEFVGGESPLFTAPSTLAKLVVVALDGDGSLEIYNGAASSNPQLPAIPDDNLPLAAVFVSDTTTEITNSAIFDLRPLFEVSREQVANLASELSDRPTFSDVNLLLDDKADIDGTPSPTFTLNQDFVSGVPTETAVLYVERGGLSNVGIRWNEALDQWEFTNDGSTWEAIGTSSLVAHTHTVADITDFNTGVDVRIAASNVSIHTDVEVTAPSDGEVLVYDTGEFVNKVLTSAEISDVDPADYADVVHTHNISDVVALQTTLDGKADDVHSHPISQLSDFTSVTPVHRHVLIYNSGPNVYENRALTLADIDDFDEGDYVHTYAGVGSPIPSETIAGDKEFTGTVTFLNGLALEENLSVEASGEPWTLDVGSVTIPDNDPGLQVDRSYVPGPNAVLYWDESSQLWFAGTVGNVFPVSSAAALATVAQPEYELQAGLGVGSYVYNLGFGVLTPPTTGSPPIGRTGLIVFVNGLKQVEGATKHYTVTQWNPTIVVTFNAGSEPALNDDVEFYGFGSI